MMSSEYKPLQVFVPFQHQVPDVIMDALYGRVPEIKREEIPPDTGFGYFAKTVPPKDSEIDEEFEYESGYPLTKLFAPPAMIASAAALAGLGYSTSEPRHFLNDEVDPDDMEADRGLREIKRIFSEGVYYQPTTTRAETPEQLHKSAALAKAQKETNRSEVINGMRKANLEAFVKSRVAQGESISELATFAAANDPETANLIREIGREL
jgi:hypothetical protein